MGEEVVLHCGNEYKRQCRYTDCHSTWWWRRDCLVETNIRNSTDTRIATARGGGGGIALWKRIEREKRVSKKERRIFGFSNLNILFSLLSNLNSLFHNKCNLFSK